MLRIKSSSRWWPVILVATFFVTIALPILHAIPAEADSCSWTDTSTIQCGGTKFTNPSTSGNTMTFGVAGGCGELIVNNYQTAKTATFQGGTVNTHTGECSQGGGTKVAETLTNTYNSVKNPAGGGTTDTNGTGAPTAPTCESSGNALAWIMCPVYDMLSNASTEIFNNVVQPFLYTPPISTSASDPSFKTWSDFRIYGDIFLVLALIITVLAQAYGGGVVDAYTVKKVLPRVLVTAILINLSVYIVAFLVDITNVIGKSLGDILTSPLQSAGAWHISIGTNTDQAVIGVFAAGLLGLFAAGHFTGFFGSLAAGGGKSAGAEFTKSALVLAFLVLVPIFLAILAVFITLIVRKGLILFLVMISPVAFALYVLPNTEQYFKKWWDLLIEALMVYPIIVAIFAIADILSVTILTANGVGNADFKADGNGNYNPPEAHIFAIIVAFFIQFLPLLAIPFAFRMAGGTLSKMHEAVTATGGKLKQSGWYANRRESAQGRYANAKAAGQRQYYTNKTAAVASGLGVYDKDGNLTGYRGGWAGKRYARHALTQYEKAGGSQAHLEADRLKAIQASGKANDPDALKAGLYRSHDEAMTKLTASVAEGGWGMNQAQATRAASAWQSVGVGWGGAASAAALQAATEDGTVFTGESGQWAYQEQSKAIAAVAGQDKSTQARLAGMVYSTNKKAGRAELSASYGAVLEGASTVASGGSISDDEAAKVTTEGMRGMSAAQWGSMKGAGMSNGTNAIAHYARRQNEALTAAQAVLNDPARRASLSPQQVGDYKKQANDAKVAISRVDAMLKGAEASGFYMPSVHVEQIEQAAIRPTTPITAKTTRTDRGGFQGDTLRIQHNTETRGKAASTTTPGRIIQTQGGRQMPPGADPSDPTRPFGT